MNSPAATATEPSNPFRSVSTHDVDEHAACLSNWNQTYDQLGTGSFVGAFEECRLKRVHVFRESLNRSVHQTGQSCAGTRTFAIPVSISGSGWLAGERFDLDSVINLGPSDAFDFRTPAEVDYVACSADAEALGEYALLVEHRDLAAELRGRAHVRARPAQAQALRTLIGTVLSLRATPDVLRHSQITNGIEQGILAALFEAVSPLAEPPQAPPSFNTRQLVVERARSYLFSHIDEPVTVADLCIRLRVSRRTLQYSFQDVFGLTPVQFLRAMRLNSVRRELKRADAAVTTVGDVAARWGFFHLSHFATDYARMFGELPSATLKKLH
ncbi:MAG: helix-turn-helix domain-containing protein [Rhodocyclaceae bacterium]|nr:helix-turn-helix domain-containing protein [Rhodocyclaceae bacterium]